MTSRTGGRVCVSAAGPPPPKAGVLLARRNSGPRNVLASMKKIRTHKATSTIGVMFGPLWVMRSSIFMAVLRGARGETLAPPISLVPGGEVDVFDVGLGAGD